MDALNDGVSWWYNWSSTPDSDIANSIDELGVEFVPMAWNGNFNVNDAIANLPASTKYILAFNEPNFKVESNMYPQQAADNWWKLEQVAAARDLKIVSAAPAYCGGGTCIDGGYENPTKWHDQFFAICPDCQVDFIASHNYEPYAEAVISLTNNLKKYGKPIWVTEYAQYYYNENQSIEQYSNTILDAFENDPDIFRYSWFTGRRNDAPRINLLGNSGQLTTLGQSYVNGSYPVQQIPGKIEAESHYRRLGTGTENTTDNGGGENVAFIANGSWDEYLVNVAQDGVYSFEFRIASLDQVAVFDIYEDDRLVKSDVTIQATGGYQNWVSSVVTGISLTPGQHLIRLDFKSKEFNINYFNVIRVSNAAPIADFSPSTDRPCINETITFIDQSIHIEGGDDYIWNFGTNATPQTATGKGPHNVSYTSGGIKNITMSISNGNGLDSKAMSLEVFQVPTGCVFEDHFNNSSADWIDGSSSFTHTETDNHWVVSNDGHDEWDSFKYFFHDGQNEVLLNLACANVDPVVKIIVGNSSGNNVLNVSLSDSTGRNVDNYSSTLLELTPTTSVFEIDFNDHFTNTYGASPGILNTRLISNLFFSINGGFASYPYTGTNAVYNTFYPGDVHIDWIGVGGAGCKVPNVISGVSSELINKASLFPNPFTSSFKLSLPLETKGVVQVINNQGVVLYSAPYKGQEEIGVDLTKGFYTVTLTSEKGVEMFSVIPHFSGENNFLR